MATTKYEVAIADGWVEVADAADETFLCENAGSIPIQFTYAASAPAVTAPFHVLGAKESMVRLGSDSLYVRPASSGAPAVVVISV